MNTKKLFEESKKYYLKHVNTNTYTTAQREYDEK